MTVPLRIGMLGAGTVGGAMIALLNDRDDIPAQVSRALVRNLNKPRAIVHADALLTDNPEEILPNSDILVEVMGGTTLAADLMLSALADGKKVVTANKAALAERWDEFVPYMQQGCLYYEAAVMAGTPVIGPLTNALRGSKPLELHAILNGTCNYILGQLEQGESYQSALKEAQRLGFAEADPTLDVEGFDAAHKLTILARLAFDPGIRWDDVKANTHGISHLTPAIIREAMEDGGRVRLVGSVYPRDGKWQVTVRPVYLDATHPLAGAETNRNGFFFNGDAVGEVYIAGAGAGAEPTASAVIADVISAIRGVPGPAPIANAFVPPADYIPEDLGEIKKHVPQS